MNFIHFGIKDLIDILLVWILAYQILRLFRGTRATYMFLGLMVIVFFALVAQFLNLAAMNWIISVFETIGLVALVIVFQPEIRRALAILGRNPALRAIFRVEEELIIPEIVKSVFSLRDRGLGGIIVIERKIGLREYIEESGVELNAKVSAPLIVSIFTYPSPLHDGAVIIRGDRIVAARVLLPLSDDPNLDPSLGTRHRAAIGITQVSDAVAIIVSEERKAVRLAFEGTLSPPHTRDSLARALSEILLLEEEEKEEDVD
jgi:diadenylate cyclase